jgi:hypothetical protein
VQFRAGAFGLIGTRRTSKEFVEGSGSGCKSWSVAMPLGAECKEARTSVAASRKGLYGALTHTYYISSL